MLSTSVCLYELGHVRWQILRAVLEGRLTLLPSPLAPERWTTPLLRPQLPLSAPEALP